MILVDTSKIPPDKLAHRKLAPLKTQMELALNHKKWINAFCIHEAGHQIYLSKMGVTEFECIGPRIEYNEDNDDFDGYIASVEPKSIPTVPDDTDPYEIVKAGAKAWTAGGAFAERLTAAPDNGSQGDRQRFDAICAGLKQKYSLVLDGDTLWEEGKNAVMKDLNSPAFRSMAWGKAHEIQSVFGW